MSKTCVEVLVKTGGSCVKAMQLFHGLGVNLRALRINPLVMRSLYPAYALGFARTNGSTTRGSLEFFHGFHRTNSMYNKGTTL